MAKRQVFSANLRLFSSDSPELTTATNKAAVLAAARDHDLFDVVFPALQEDHFTLLSDTAFIPTDYGRAGRPKQTYVAGAWIPHHRTLDHHPELTTGLGEDEFVPDEHLYPGLVQVESTSRLADGLGIVIFGAMEVRAEEEYALHDEVAEFNRKTGLAIQPVGLEERATDLDLESFSVNRIFAAIQKLKR